MIESRDSPSILSSLTTIEKQKAQALWYVLQSLLREKALKVMRKAKVPSGNGLEAWRLLVHRNRDTSDDTALGMMQAIMSYKFGEKEEDVQDRLDDFEILCDKYDYLPDVDEIQDNVKRAAVVKGRPEPLRTHLQLRSRENKTFDEVLDCIEGYLKAKEVWRDEESDKQHKQGKKDDGGMQPMDVDAVWKGGKGKGAAKGGQGACYTCGKTGHMSKYCWSAGKCAKGGKAEGKGKGSKGDSKGKGGKGDKGGKAGGKGVCYNCGKTGHMSKDCWSPRTQQPPHQVYMMEQPQYEQNWNAPMQQQMQTPWQPPMYQQPQQPQGSAASISSNASTVPVNLSNLPQMYQQPIPLRAVFVEEIERVEPWMIFGLRIRGEKEQQQRRPTPEEINAVRRRRTSYDKPVLDSGSQVHACPPEHGYGTITVW
ncbi:unnamed protein product [Polarella glacialis]|uniref:CCHC-type domain-containing protein n=1 Tax=Polarella glacialis TaxID=89957 RepID=A0A813GVN3_POLGL|nr:unnamed protein product [Polarella glacialis]